MAEKILVVDDDIDSLKLIGLMLQRQGYEVLAAGTGQQALAKANEELPDLIILDVMMPDMNGYEVCRRLRGNPDTQSIPIIMFTAKTLIDDKVAGFEAGADDYLTKPTHPAELSSRIKQILARNTNRAPKEVNRGSVIAVIGAKGGIGTTTIALNIAIAMTPTYKPIVADFRLGAGSMGLMMGFDRVAGMANIISRTPNDIRPSLIERELVTHPSGLRGLLSSARAKEMQLNFSVESVMAVVQSLRTLGNPTILDIGTGYSTVNSYIMANVDRIVMLVEPITMTLHMAHELLRDIQTEINKPVDIVVVTRTQSKAQLPWHDVESALGKEILAIISPAPELAFQAMEAGTPIILQQPSAIVSNQMIKLASDIYA